MTGLAILTVGSLFVDRIRPLSSNEKRYIIIIAMIIIWFAI